MIVAETWQRKKLGEIAEFQNGGAWNESEYSRNGIAVVRVTNCKEGTVVLGDCKRLPETSLEKYRKHQLRTGDLIIATVGSHPTQPGSVVGRSSVVPRTANGTLLNQNAVRLRAIEGLCDQKFLNSLSFSVGFRQYIAAHARGAASQVRMSLGLLKEMQMALPPLPTQQRIAAILSAYDDLIETNTRRIAILEEMARRLYEEWFVHFRFPGHEKVEFEAGIPEGWARQPFSTVAQFINGYAFKPSDWSSQGVPIVKIKELKGGVKPDTPRFEGTIAEKYKIENGDILFSWSADLDAYIWQNGTGWLNQHLFQVVPKEGMDRLFIYFSLREEMNEFRARSAGTTMRHIKRSALDEVSTVRPDKAVQDAFVQRVHPMVQLVLGLKKKNANLRAQRDLLLPKLVSGEIDLSAAEAELEAAE